jgi:hypothetical protein
MAQLIGGEYRVTPKKLTATGQYGNVQLDTDGNMKVALPSTVTAGLAPTAVTPASYVSDDIASASSVLGCVGTIPASTGVLYVRCPTDDKAYSHLDWWVKTDYALTVQLYRAKTVVDSAYITLANMTDTQAPVLNGVTLTGEDTAADILRAGGKFDVAGTNAAADITNATDLCALINGGVYVTASTVVDTNALTFTHNGSDYTYTAAASAVLATRVFSSATDDTARMVSLAAGINHKANVVCTAADTNGKTLTINGLTYTGAATEVLTTRVFDGDSAANAMATSIAACVNHRDTITLASAVANDSVTITATPAAGGPKTVVYTGKAGVSQKTLNKFSVDTSDTARAHELCACINDTIYGHGATLIASHAAGVVTIKPLLPTTTITTATVVGDTRVVCVAGMGVPGVTATASTATVSFTRDNVNVPAITMTSSSATLLAVLPAYGIPGVTASSNIAELRVVSDWDLPINVTENATTLSWGRFGVPGVYATNQLASTEAACSTVTVVPKARNGYAAATTIQFVGVTTTGVVTTNTLASLIADGSSASLAANNTTAGTLYHQWADGWPECYIGLTAATASAATVTVGAQKYAA